MTVASRECTQLYVTSIILEADAPIDLLEQVIPAFDLILVEARPCMLT